MSENGEEEKQVQKEPTIMPPKTFFISQINSYTGRVLYNELKISKDPMIDQSQYKFRGTIEEGKNHIYSAGKRDIPEGVEKIVQMERTREFRNNILESDVIIYDLMNSSFEEVDYVIKTLKTSKLSSNKTLMILSNVLVWANSIPKVKKEGEEEEAAEEEPEEEEPEEEEQPAEEEGGEEKPKKPKIVPFKESDYHMRVPHEDYERLKTLETLAMSAPKTQPMLKVHILCCGIRYGLGEGTLYHHFKQAWMQKIPSLQYVGKGNNLCPTIHIIDLARLAKRVIDDEIIKPYIFAVDRTKNPTQKRIIQAISNGIGTGKIVAEDPEKIPQGMIYRDFFMLNLKIKSSDAFNDKEPPEGEELEETEAAKLKFPWHCEKGILENARLLNNEFNEIRDLKPVKLFISGPPASGKTFYAQKILQQYNIPRVHVKEIVDKAFAMAKTENEEDAEANDIKAKIEELRDAAVAKIEEAREGIDFGDDGPPEIDREALQIRLPEEMIYNLLRKRLQENDCRNRGYILDGFPRNFKDCNYVFLYKPKKIDENGEEIEEEEPELEEGQEKSFDGYVPDQTIFPHTLLVVNQDDEFLIDRIKNQPEEMIEGTHYNQVDMKRRLKNYREANESQVANPSIEDFFKSHNVLSMRYNASTADDVVWQSLQIFIERKGKPNNFLPGQEFEEANRRIQEEAEQVRKQEMSRLRILMEEGVEQQLKKQKEKQIRDNLEGIREEQKEQLDQKSDPIRQYLMDNLVPILTDGLIELCKQQPADPVDSLAEYLFRRSLDVPYPDPTAY